MRAAREGMSPEERKEALKNSQRRASGGAAAVERMRLNPLHPGTGGCGDGALTGV